MKINPERMSEMVADQQRRLESPLWDETNMDDGLLESMRQPMDVELVPVRVARSAPFEPVELPRFAPVEAERSVERRPVPVSAPAPSPALVPAPQVDALVRASAELLKMAQRLEAARPVEAGGTPRWLRDAAGDPRTYDAPDPSRVNVCARVLPDTYARVHRAKDDLGLRSVAGTWEYLLRLGLAAARHL